jgi:hypothetical protein
LIIRLIPAGGIKVKNLYKQISNMPQTKMRSFAKKTDIDADLLSTIKKFWNAVEKTTISRLDQIHFDKLPTILFHFVYANIGETLHREIFMKSMPKILENLSKYSLTDISDLVYSYSRVQIPNAVSFYLKLGDQIKSMDLRSTTLPKLSNIYWAFANAKIHEDSICDALEKALFESIEKLETETFNQFCNTLALKNKIMD